MSSCSIRICSISKQCGRGDVFEIDAAEGRGDAAHRLDELLRMLGMDLDVEHVDVGEVLEQDRLAFHHRLAGERADIAQPEHGAAVGDHGDQIALVGVAVGIASGSADRCAAPVRQRRGCRPERDPVVSQRAS
jgi:hypothetical protein